MFDMSRVFDLTYRAFLFFYPCSFSFIIFLSARTTLGAFSLSSSVLTSCFCLSSLFLSISRCYCCLSSESLLSTINDSLCCESLLKFLITLGDRLADADPEWDWTASLSSCFLSLFFWKYLSNFGCSSTRIRGSVTS